jgi:signal peptidase II
MKLGIKFDKERCLPLLLTAIIILVDQCTKAFIAAKWPINSMIVDVFKNDFLQIYHVRNKAIAFSLGAGIPDTIKPAAFVVLPLLVLGVLLWYYLSSNDFSRMQRWAVAGILGGGMGNIIDRIFRSEGVVDFVSVKFYGLFGFERWPTFNVADSSVVVCCILLFITIIIDSKNKKPEAAK